MAGPLRVLELLVSTGLGGGPAQVRELVRHLAPAELAVTGGVDSVALPSLVILVSLLEFRTVHCWNWRRRRDAVGPRSSGADFSPG